MVLESLLDYAAHGSDVSTAGVAGVAFRTQFGCTDGANE